MSQIFYVRRIMGKILGTKKEAEQNRTYLKNSTICFGVRFIHGRETRHYVNSLPKFKVFQTVLNMLKY